MLSGSTVRTRVPVSPGSIRVFCLTQKHTAKQGNGHLTFCVFFFSPPPSPAVQVKKYFELEPLARGKRWILEGSDVDNMETVKDTFGQFISLLEDKDTEPARI
jgi:hypothetical protein